MKSTFSILFLAILLSIGSVHSYASSVAPGKTPKEKVADMTEAEKLARLEQLKLRAEEIKKIDRSELTRAERKDLRKEVREMRKEARTMKGGVYLSVGAIIIIILLLILIL